MFSFKYRPNDLVNERKVTVSDAFTRLGHSAAYYGMNAWHSNVTEEHIFSLWSYETLILTVNVRFDYCIGKMNITIYVNRDSFNCSNTTISHVSRFLDWLRVRYGLGTEISYTDCKRAMGCANEHDSVSFDCTKQAYAIVCKADAPITWVAFNERNLKQINKMFELPEPIGETL